MTATQAPTPGPLSLGAGPYSCIRCDNSTWNDDDICDQCAAEACAPENAIDWSDAPTAPVEASGSLDETVTEVAVSTIRWAMGRGDDLRDYKEPLEHVLTAALRPQPSGETREAVARLTKDVATVKSFSANAATFYDGPNKRYIGDVAADIETILALLSARPLALGGQS